MKPAPSQGGNWPPAVPASGNRRWRWHRSALAWHARTGRAPSYAADDTWISEEILNGYGALRAGLRALGRDLDRRRARRRFLWRGDRQHVLWQSMFALRPDASKIAFAHAAPEWPTEQNGNFSTQFISVISAASSFTFGPKSLAGQKKHIGRAEHHASCRKGSDNRTDFECAKQRQKLADITNRNKIDEPFNLDEICKRIINEIDYIDKKDYKFWTRNNFFKILLSGIGNFIIKNKFC